MITKETLSLQMRYYGTRAISAVYYGSRLVWEAISSCFGSGRWINRRPWKNGEAWRNK